MPVLRRLPAVADLTLVTAGAMTANVAGYLLQMLASRWLGVTGYSEFASLLAVQLLCAVPALALQNVVARERVRGADVAALRGLQWRCAVIVAIVAAVLVPVVTAVLSVGVLASAAALGAAPALVLLSGEQGILQGSRRFRALAVVLGAAGVARVVPALVVLAAGGGTAPALWAAAVGIVVAAAFARFTAGSPASRVRAPATQRSPDVTPEGPPGGAAAAGAMPGFTVEGPTPATAAGAGTRDDGRPGGDRPPAQERDVFEDEAARSRCENAAEQPWLGGAADGSAAGRRTRGTSGRAAQSVRSVGVLPVLRAAQVQAALMALSSADLIVARIVLDEADASRYALGAIAAKIAFWLPQAVGVVLYPRMAQPTHSARAIRDALAVLSGIGIIAVVGAALAAPVAPLFAGQDYAPIEGLLWLFALQGALLAVLQGALLSAIAVDRTALAAATWLGLAIEVVLMTCFARSVPTMITTAVGVASATTMFVAVIVLRTADRSGTAEPSVSG
ncbi:polysaccharide biosynthesis protein [Nocardia sp. CA-084685]|uniref:polysaccharide biosynthesis protein n=1 Tax=Nocardia sp. CA-084685 TaxID=3239970 RepID=UPI003D95C61B